MISIFSLSVTCYSASEESRPAVDVCRPHFQYLATYICVEETVHTVCNCCQAAFQRASLSNAAHGCVELFSIICHHKCKFEVVSFQGGASVHLKTQALLLKMQEEGFPESPAMPFEFRIKLWALCMGNILAMIGWQKVCLPHCLHSCLTPSVLPHCLQSCAAYLHLSKLDIVCKQNFALQL